MLETIRPQLAEPLEPKLLAEYIEDNNASFEQKCDGKRLLIVVEDGQAMGVNRNSVVAVDPEIASAANSLGERLVLDGEVVGRTFRVFDMPIALDLVTPDTPYSHRRAALHQVIPLLEKQTNKIAELPLSRTADEKIALLEWCRKYRTEGIMVKNLLAGYKSGERTTDWLKAKMVKTCDVFIVALMIDGKRNAEVAVFDEETALVRVGTVTMTDRRLEHAKIGDVLEVRYLYASDDRKLVQPHVLRFRTDKTAHQCTVGQLIFTNKHVIYRRDVS